MAPSRALFRYRSIAQRRPSPRLLSPVCHVQYQQTAHLTYHSVLLTALSLGPSRCSSLITKRWYSQRNTTPPEPPDYLNEAELNVFHKIRTELDPVKLEVQDISGGCGSMYAIEVESPRFKGLSVIKQHKLVNSVLAEEIKNWHGVQLRTRAV
ncbi:bola-like protein [Lojkania enalia]|uniref:Bola-like protein n=1 Tax=Lojkania enalia TaxID=147567 RepID=A0A9P4TRD6_9PLEO|nr:bola-like protein [Didymosphaeria enalia]